MSKSNEFAKKFSRMIFPCPLCKTKTAHNIAVLLSVRWKTANTIKNKSVYRSLVCRSDQLSADMYMISVRIFTISGLGSPDTGVRAGPPTAGRHAHQTVLQGGGHGGVGLLNRPAAPPRSSFAPATNALDVGPELFIQKQERFQKNILK